MACIDDDDPVSPRPWHWAGNRKRGMTLSTWRPGWGRCTVMGFVRQGMNGAQPQFNVDMHLVKGEELAQLEVPYREDIVGFNHPDAEFMLMAVNEHDGLVADRDRLRSAIQEVVDDHHFCTYIYHEDDRGDIDPECPGVYCFLSRVLDPTCAGPTLAVVE